MRRAGGEWKLNAGSTIDAVIMDPTNHIDQALFAVGDQVRINKGEMTWHITRVYWSDVRDCVVYDLNEGSATAFAVSEDKLQPLSR